METMVDTQALEAQVKAMYEKVALSPQAEFHFEMGRALAERLGYDSALLDRVPAEAIASFAGVGEHLSLAAIQKGESVVDLGSGSGLDTFVAAELVGRDGWVLGVDMTDAQRAKAEALRADADYEQITYLPGYIHELPVPSGSYDVAISNGVINLAPDKGAVFREIARVLAPGGRLALSDIVTGVELPQGIKCNADLWAACIGGAMERQAYQRAIAAAGLEVVLVKPNPEYRFLSDSANGAAGRYAVSSLSLLAIKR